jgi:hypothetical protein
MKWERVCAGRPPQAKPSVPNARGKRVCKQDEPIRVGNSQFWYHAIDVVDQWPPITRLIFLIGLSCRFCRPLLPRFRVVYLCQLQRVVGPIHIYEVHIGLYQRVELVGTWRIEKPSVTQLTRSRNCASCLATPTICSSHLFRQRIHPGTTQS